MSIITAGKPSLATIERSVAKGKKRKPNPNRVNKGAIKVDPIAQQATEFIEGIRCIVCRGLKDHKGRCHHERIEDFERECGELLEFAAINDGKGEAWTVMQTIRRQALKAGLRDTDLAVIMVTMRARLGIEPKWSPPRNSTADELPL